ncbi:MAG: hypothetical protein GY694_01220 [Gammaproteobacteria bacterium]|nr:hypothetical protein [Gammaproteobacteria bacterium]
MFKQALGCSLTKNIRKNYPAEYVAKWLKRANKRQIGSARLAFVTGSSILKAATWQYRENRV